MEEKKNAKKFKEICWCDFVGSFGCKLEFYAKNKQFLCIKKYE